MQHRRFIPVAALAALTALAFVAAPARSAGAQSAAAQTGTADTTHHAGAKHHGRKRRPKGHARHARETQADLQQEAKISMDSAKAVAVQTVPGGSVESSELEREHGKLLYSFDIRLAGKPGVEEVQVDALTGKLLSHTHETPAAERKEARQERKEKKSMKPTKP